MWWITFSQPFHITPTYPPPMWISFPHCPHFVLLAVLLAILCRHNINLSTADVDKFSTLSTSLPEFDGYPHFLWISFPHCPHFVLLAVLLAILCRHNTNLSTVAVDKFSTLSTSLPVFLDKFGNISQ